MANFKAPCVWCKFGQVFNGQLDHLNKLGDWKTTENWPMLNFFWSESFKILWYLGVYWPHSHRVTELESNRHQRVPILRVGEIYLTDFNKPPFLLHSQGDKIWQSHQFYHLNYFYFKLIAIYSVDNLKVDNLQLLTAIFLCFLFAEESNDGLVSFPSKCKEQWF